MKYEFSSNLRLFNEVNYKTEEQISIDIKSWFAKYHSRTYTKRKDAMHHAPGVDYTVT